MPLSELWSVIKGYFSYELLSIAGSPVTPIGLLSAAMVFLFFLLLSRLIRRWIIQKTVAYLEVREAVTRKLNLFVHSLIMLTGILFALQVIVPQSKILSTTSEVLNFPLFLINETPVTLFSFFMFLIVILVFLTASRLVRNHLLPGILEQFNIEKGTTYTFTRVAHYLIMLIGGIVAFQFIGISFSGLVVVFGFLSVGIGFGLQNITSNFVAGLILLFERPIQVGDRVTVGDTEGDVVEINIRSTTIRSLDNITIIVPNSEFISASVINWSHGDPRVLLNIPVGVSYDSDPDRVLKTLEEVAAENSDVLKTPAPEVHLANFGDSAWDIVLRVWIDNPQEIRDVRSDLNFAIVRKFRENGIEIPFPQRDLHLRSPLPVPFSGTERYSPEN